METPYRGEPCREPSAGERLAATALATAERRWRAAELALFRERLLATVEFVSPVLVDALAAEAVPLDGVAMRLRSGRAAADSPGRSGGASVRWLTRTHRFRRDRDLLDFTYEGRILRPVGHPGGALAVRARHCFIDVAVSVGDGLLKTSGAEAELWLPRKFPDIILNRLPGERLDRVVGHPLFHGRGYVVTAADFVGGRSRLTIDVGVVDYRVPWATVVAGW